MKFGITVPNCKPLKFHGRHYTARGEPTEQGVQFLPALLQQPRIPVWVGGASPHYAPFRRAAQWDGVIPL